LALEEIGTLAGAEYGIDCEIMGASLVPIHAFTVLEDGDY